MVMRSQQSAGFMKWVQGFCVFLVASQDFIRDAAVLAAQSGTHGKSHLRTIIPRILSLDILGHKVLSGLECEQRRAKLIQLTDLKEIVLGVDAGKRFVPFFVKDGSDSVILSHGSSTHSNSRTATPDGDGVAILRNNMAYIAMNNREICDSLRFVNRG